MYRLLFICIALLFFSVDQVHADRVDDHVRSFMKRRSIPGLQLAVVRHGKIIKAQSYGTANIELNSPVTNETMFEIASNSKQYTAGAILLLEQDGKLRLDDGITKYLPGLPPTYSAISVRHLLNHTSGVKDYIEEFQLNRGLVYTNKELIERIGQNELNFRPGENARYSTTGYLLLGLIIEQITGKPYGEFLSERIFAPLGMKHTKVIDLAEIIPGRASGYMFENGVLRNGKFVAQTLRATADIGLMTTALDTVKWDAALNDNKIFTKASLDAMFTPGKLKNGLPAYNDWNGYFGPGWFVDDYLGHREINHGGTFITGFHSNISRFVDKRLTIIVLTNRVLSSPAYLGYEVAGIYDPDLRPPYALKAGTDNDPERTRRLNEFLSGIADGAPDPEQTTTGFRERFNSGQKSDIAEFMKELKSFSYVGCKNTGKREVERVGARVSVICHFRAKTEDRDYFVSFYLTKESKIADIWIFD